MWIALENRDKLTKYCVLYSVQGRIFNRVVLMYKTACEKRKYPCRPSASLSDKMKLHISVYENRLNSLLGEKEGVFTFKIIICQNTLKYKSYRNNFKGFSFEVKLKQFVPFFYTNVVILVTRHIRLARFEENIRKTYKIYFGRKSVDK